VDALYPFTETSVTGLLPHCGFELLDERLKRLQPDDHEVLWCFARKTEQVIENLLSEAPSRAVLASAPHPVEAVRLGAGETWRLTGVPAETTIAFFIASASDRASTLLAEADHRDAVRIAAGQEWRRESLETIHGGRIVLTAESPVWIGAPLVLAV
jgi:hypothetical protein